MFPTIAIGAAALASLVTILAQVSHARPGRARRRLLRAAGLAPALLLPYAIPLESADGHTAITVGEIAAVCLALGVGAASALDLLAAAAARGRRTPARWGHAGVAGAAIVGAGTFVVAQIVSWQVTLGISPTTPVYFALSLASLALLHAIAARRRLSLAWPAIAAATAFRLCADQYWPGWERPAMACEGLVAPALAFLGVALLAPRRGSLRFLGLTRQPAGNLALVPVAASLALHVAVTVPAVWSSGGGIGVPSLSPPLRITLSLAAAALTALAVRLCARAARTRTRGRPAPRPIPRDVAPGTT